MFVARVMGLLFCLARAVRPADPVGSSVNGAGTDPDNARRSGTVAVTFSRRSGHLAGAWMSSGNRPMRDAGTDQELRMREVGRSDKSVNDRITWSRWPQRVGQQPLGGPVHG